jgi:hypothetical protein
MAELFNELLSRPEDIPKEIISSRLISLNKEPDNNGNIDAIRRRSINFYLIKILERVIQTILDKLIYCEEREMINKKQIGFIRNLG